MINVEEVKKLRNEKKTLQEIANVYGVSRQAIWGKLYPEKAKEIARRKYKTPQYRNYKKHYIHAKADRKFENCELCQKHTI